jgi:hypothetical protein
MRSEFVGLHRLQWPPLDSVHRGYLGIKIGLLVTELLLNPVSAREPTNYRHFRFPDDHNPTRCLVNRLRKAPQ